MDGVLFIDDLKKSIRDAMNKSQASHDQTSPSENDTITQEASNLASETQAVRKRKNKKKDRPLKIFGGICIAIFVISMILSPQSSADTSDAAKKALTDKVSTSLPAGTILFANDENIGPQDYTIIHKYEESDTKIWVWDYAAEDGDYVQVLAFFKEVHSCFKPRI